MIISGKLIAEEIYNKLKTTILSFKKINIIPGLAIILIGDNPDSISYVKQKRKKAETNGIKVIINELSADSNEKEILDLINSYNQNPRIHGIIVQLPLPKGLNSDKIISQIAKEKDVDGFNNNSLFQNPTVKAVIYFLEKIIEQENNKSFLKNWLKDKQVIVTGRGKTAGQPIYNYLSKISKKIVQINRTTKNPNKLIQRGDIIISCTGQTKIINKSNCKKGAILISVGMHFENGKAKGEYDEEEIKNCATWYTPTPGGVGPVTVACLLENIITACERQQ